MWFWKCSIPISACQWFLCGLAFGELGICRISPVWGLGVNDGLWDLSAQKMKQTLEEGVLMSAFFSFLNISCKGRLFCFCLYKTDLQRPGLYVTAPMCENCKLSDAGHLHCWCTRCVVQIVLSFLGNQSLQDRRRAHTSSWALYPAEMETVVLCQFVNQFPWNVSKVRDSSAQVPVLKGASRTGFSFYRNN